MRRKNNRLANFASNTFLLVCLVPGARAVDAIVLEVRELSVAGVPIEGASARLDLLSDQKTRMTLTARGAALPDPIGRITNIELACDAPVIAEPRFGCEAGMLTGLGGPAGRIDMRVAAEMRTDTGVTSFKGSGLKVAGTTASLDGRLDDKGWQVKGAPGRPRSPRCASSPRPGSNFLPISPATAKRRSKASRATRGAGTRLRRNAETRWRRPHQRGQHHRHGQAQPRRRGLRARLADADTALQIDIAGLQGQMLVNRCCWISARIRWHSKSGAI